MVDNSTKPHSPRPADVERTRIGLLPGSADDHSAVATVELPNLRGDRVTLIDVNSLPPLLLDAVMGPAPSKG